MLKKDLHCREGPFLVLFFLGRGPLEAAVHAAVYNFISANKSDQDAYGDREK
jgi:hypothetical protein